MGGEGREKENKKGSREKALGILDHFFFVHPPLPLFFHY